VGYLKEIENTADVVKQLYSEAAALLKAAPDLLPQGEA